MHYHLQFIHYIYYTCIPEALQVLFLPGYITRTVRSLAGSQTPPGIYLRDKS